MHPRRSPHTPADRRSSARARRRPRRIATRGCGPRRRDGGGNWSAQWLAWGARLVVVPRQLAAPEPRDIQHAIHAHGRTVPPPPPQTSSGLSGVDRQLAAPPPGFASQFAALMPFLGLLSHRHGPLGVGIPLVPGIGALFL